MDIKKNRKRDDNCTPKVMNGGSQPKSRDTGLKDAIPGINTPGIELPAFNPPVPNRAWTAMKKEIEDDGLTEKERLDIIYGEEEDF